VVFRGVSMSGQAVVELSFTGVQVIAVAGSQAAGGVRGLDLALIGFAGPTGPAGGEAGVMPGVWALVTTAASNGMLTGRRWQDE
jgi:hypothetical protein